MPVSTEVSLSELVVLFSNLSLFQEKQLPSSQSELFQYEQEKGSPSFEESEKESGEEAEGAVSQKGEKDSSKKAIESPKTRSLKQGKGKLPLCEVCSKIL